MTSPARRKSGSSLSPAHPPVQAREQANGTRDGWPGPTASNREQHPSRRGTGQTNGRVSAARARLRDHRSAPQTHGRETWGAAKWWDGGGANRGSHYRKQAGGPRRPACRRPSDALRCAGSPLPDWSAEAPGPNAPECHAAFVTGGTPRSALGDTDGV